MNEYGASIDPESSYCVAQKMLSFPARANIPTLCLHCKIPVCHECSGFVVSGQLPPKALTNDNFISYADAFIVREQVTWLEATIACPIFTGMITYYMEEQTRTSHAAKGNRHLMTNALAQPTSTVAVRGNVFSFLLPWDSVMKKLSQAWADKDFTHWPLDQDTVAEILTVRLVRGHEALIDQFRQLKVRSRIVKQMANIYIENRYEDLMKNAKVITLLAAKDGNLRERFKEHINKRVDEQYPPSVFDTAEGCVPEAVRVQALAAMDKEPAQLRKTPVHDGKQGIGHDVSQSCVDNAFASLRPSIVVGERNTSAEDPQKLMDKISGVQIRMSTEFEEQFNTEYLSRIFPWALNYSCGGMFAISKIPRCRYMFDVLIYV